MDAEKKKSLHIPWSPEGECKHHLRKLINGLVSKAAQGPEFESPAPMKSARYYYQQSVHWGYGNRKPPGGPWTLVQLKQRAPRLVRHPVPKITQGMIKKDIWHPHLASAQTCTNVCTPAHTCIHNTHTLYQNMIFLTLFGSLKWILQRMWGFSSIMKCLSILWD